MFKKTYSKKWPYFSKLIVKIKEFYKNKYPVLVAPGPGEVSEAKILNAKVVLDNGKPIKLNFLISLINSAKVCYFKMILDRHISVLI